MGEASIGSGIRGIEDNIRSPKTGEEHPSLTHSFDTGATYACMVLQAQKLNW
ncbi:hypothetical protein ACPOL_7150 (plasmid) [Acidisarcina polymorpha]|uniref:Uncharacterized protein n=1 Tax=Acidisarcina polymorpha TaxID=2211140 RepID=A0A2Z5GAR4_9BACT|nr:hypothetical protein ACPOL_7138 [Acidisarcina polymorpha]AXC16342.1 hypothetical protein ACPOL_7150 [Acidisarcina polymorpha]